MIAVESSAAKPFEGFSFVIFSPTVLITLYPRVNIPKTIPMAPVSSTHSGTTDCDSTEPKFSIVEIIAAIGPTAFATSLEPCAKAIEHAVNIIKTANLPSIFSMSPKSQYIISIKCENWVNRVPPSCSNVPFHPPFL